MATIFEYLKWRGDLPFSTVRPGEVDGVIFAMTAYVDYTKLCHGETRTMSEAAAGYCADGKYEKVNLGLILPSRQINKTFCEAARTRRYGGSLITDFKDRTDSAEGYQFSAVTYHIDGGRMVVVFRGTDDSIAGWREDCRLAFLDEIPAQRMAVEYLEMVAAKYPEEKIYITGHSKGGNLSVYSAIKCSDGVKERIVRAYSFDGPGFSRSILNSEEYGKIRDKISVIIPQSSTVGTMFEKGDRYGVVKSTNTGVFQHDPYSWPLEGPRFVKLKELSKVGKKNEEQFRKKMSKMTVEEKREFVETLFDVIYATEATTLTELTRGGLKKFNTIIKTYGGLDKERKEMMTEILLRVLELKKA
ncbi:MAG: DUF2974 domain-containing protein [Ruminococcaceae bacterium]|nr:DUF2974 domain-containing protein [Oscillospiraceae bacterium]